MLYFLLDNHLQMQNSAEKVLKFKNSYKYLMCEKQVLYCSWNVKGHCINTGFMSCSSKNAAKIAINTSMLVCP